MTKPKGSIPGVAAKREFGVDDFAKAKNYAVSEVVNDRLLFTLLGVNSNNDRIYDLPRAFLSLAIILAPCYSKQKHIFLKQF